MKKTTKKKKWTREELALLIWWAGSKSSENLAKMFGRTKDAIRFAMYKQNIKPSQGTYSLREAARLLRVGRRKIQHAAKKLRQQWKKLNSTINSKYFITEEQFLSLKQFFKKGA